MEKFTCMFPSLTSLVVELPEADNAENLRHFFPSHTLSGKPIAIAQLTYLGIAFIGDCSSELIQSVQRMFPNLETFKHFRHSGKRKNGVKITLVVCEHRCQMDKDLGVNVTDSLELGCGYPKDCNYSPLYDKLKPHSVRQLFFHWEKFLAGVFGSVV